MTTTQDTTKDPAAKAAAVALLTKGLASQSEVGRLAGASRQLVAHWAAEIPIEKNRNTVLAKLWRQELARKR